MTDLLDNITWFTLSGPHAKYAAGTEGARRYARGFSPILGFADGRQPDFAALAPFCEPGEHFYCDGWSGTVPHGWQLDAESTMFKMIWDDEMPAADEAPEAVPLGPEHASQALELAALTRPGPFGPRTIELGEYFGCFEGPRPGRHGRRAYVCRNATRDQRRMYASGFSGAGIRAPAHAQARSPADAAGGDAVSARHA